MSDPIFRASYTILSTWASGNWEQAIKYYFHLEKFVTPAMVAGREAHKKWEEHINATKTLPTEFAAPKPLVNPQTELKLTVHIAPWLDAVGVIDCLDEPIVYEFKTGKSDSEFYARSYQPAFYAMLATYNNKLVTRSELHHYDQYTKKADMSIVWITDEQLRNALEWCQTLGAEMHNYFLTNGLYQRYGTYVPNAEGKVVLTKTGGLPVQGGAPVSDVKEAA